MKHLAFEFVGVTEAAALAAIPWVGRGWKNEADAAATEAMRRELNRIAMDAVVVIGEGELDDAPMLYIGEKVGTGVGASLDIAVDPLEGTNLIAKGQDNSITVIAVAPRRSLLHAPDMYMEKIAVGRRAAEVIDIDAPLLDNMKRVAEANKKKLSELIVAVQDRDRHHTIIHQVQQAGARIHLFYDGDVVYTVAAAIEESPIDMMVGIGGAPEGVVSAVALRCLGGGMQARLLPGNEEEYNRCRQMGIEQPRDPLTMEQIVSSDQCLFVATGVTDGILLKGVRYNSGKKKTHSLLTYGKANCIHFIESVYPDLLSG